MKNLFHVLFNQIITYKIIIKPYKLSLIKLSSFLNVVEREYTVDGVNGGRLVCVMDWAASTTLQFLAVMGREVAKPICDAPQ